MDCFESVINEGRRLASRIKDPTHDIIHVEGVVKIALSLAQHYPATNKKVLEIAAWWHDISRETNSKHQIIGAENAKEFLLGAGANEDFAKKVYTTIISHSWESTKSETIEGIILHDADKLEYISLSRWQHVIELRDDKYMLPFIERVGKLKKSLILPEAKEMYDKIFPKFKELIFENKEWKSLIPIKNAIKDL